MAIKEYSTYVIVPYQIMDSGVVTPSMSYTRSVITTEENAEQKVKEVATALLKSYPEVGIYKLTKLGSRDVRIVDYPSMKESKIESNKPEPVLDDLEI